MLGHLDSSWGGKGSTQSPYLWGLVKAPAGNEGGKDMCILHFSGSSKAQSLPPPTLPLPPPQGSMQSKPQGLFLEVPAQGQDEYLSTPPLR